MRAGELPAGAGSISRVAMQAAPRPHSAVNAKAVWNCPYAVLDPTIATTTATPTALPIWRDVLSTPVPVE